MNIKNQKALTLLEILVSLAVFSVVMTAIYNSFLVGNRSWVAYNNNVDVQRQVRNAFFFMTRELREAKNIFITKEEGTVKITFTRPEVGFVSYTWQGNENNPGQIVREHESEKRILASNISSLSVEQLPKGIFLEIKGTKKPLLAPRADFSLKGKIALRWKMVRS